jgi:hypothetical protein
MAGGTWILHSSSTLYAYASRLTRMGHIFATLIVIDTMTIYTAITTSFWTIGRFFGFRWMILSTIPANVNRRSCKQ